MHHKFDPHIFVDQPMHLARSAENDFRVMVAGHSAGRIFATLRSSGRHVWLWTVTGPYLPGAGLNGSGDADDLPDAKRPSAPPSTRGFNGRFVRMVPSHGTSSDRHSEVIHTPFIPSDSKNPVELL